MLGEVSRWPACIANAQVQHQDWDQDWDDASIA